MTVKPTDGARERYLDPEPLIAIWPLWIVEDGKGHMSIAGPPGIPVRVPPRPRRRAPEPAQADPAAQNDNHPTVPSAAKATEPDADPAPATSAKGSGGTE
jgi:hypothetical protein